MNKRLPAVLNSYEQLALLKQPNPKAPTGLRNLCLISLMLKTGLRVSEVINLKENDIDWNNGKIHIAASGAASERTLWINREEVDLLARWRKIKPGKSSYFFSTLDGKQIQDRYIREMIKRLARKAGINKDVYPHLLRYTFAADLMRETQDIHILKEALGHKDISATHTYAKILFEEYNNPLFIIAIEKRSGTKIPAEEQQHFSFIDKDKDEQLLNASCSKRDEPEKGLARAEKRREKERSSKYSVKRSGESINKFRINLDVKQGNNDLPIPAIKCSNCDYILHYQKDCPKCGTSFIAILRHWGRDI